VCSRLSSRKTHGFLILTTLATVWSASSFGSPASTSAAPSSSGSSSALEVTVIGERTNAPEKGAEAVKIVELRAVQSRAVDIGDVLARTEGVSVQREAGLGSAADFGLNGLYDNHVRLLLDGVPIEFAGYPSGIANIPIGLIDHIEIYQGVVPLRFGTDALGGAVNLVTRQRYRSTYGFASFQVGSFGTYRATAQAGFFDPKTGWTANASAFFDYALNDYLVHVEVPDSQGHPRNAYVPRFHDRYSQYGVGVETGFVDRAWADKFLLRFYVSNEYKQIQSDLLMNTPYGDATSYDLVAGFTVRYEKKKIAQTQIGVNGFVNIAQDGVQLHDDGNWIYNWLGDRIAPRHYPGEIYPGNPQQSTTTQKSLTGRLTFERPFDAFGTLRLTLAPIFTKQSAFNAIGVPGQTVSPRADYFMSVEGLEWETNLWGDRVQNIAFGKHYWNNVHYDSSSLNPISTSHFGGGDEIRVLLTKELWVKASYEYAARMPTVGELLGDSVTIRPNPSLAPEVSHNANLGIATAFSIPKFGQWSGNLTGFVREVRNLILLAPIYGINLEASSYSNVWGVSVVGFSGQVSFKSNDSALRLDSNFTWFQSKNVSDQGPFQVYNGQLIPARPWMFYNFGGSYRALADIARAHDSLTIGYALRYVKSFLTGWANAGVASSQYGVPDQLTHDIYATYRLPTPAVRASTTVEVHNLTNTTTYDFFGAQTPGRSYFIKEVVEF
jgi:outer membrane cobalamin receptor